MEWEFTPAQLVCGEAVYGLSEFRRDLGEEVCGNLPGLDEPELDRLFRIIYDLHYWLATGNNYHEFEGQFADQPMLVPLLRGVHAHCTGNVEMLGAILQRLIMNGVEAGAPLVHERDRLTALADPIRARLLLVLERHELTVGELRAALQLPQSTVSRHLRALADAGWVTSREDGTSNRYRMATRELDTAGRRLWHSVRA